MPWFDTFFNEDYNRTYTGLTPERTQRECDFIQDILELQPEHEILDIPCGFGRHAMEFTRRGYKVTGMEYHPVQVEQAKKKMATEGISFPIIQADMRAIPHENRYHRLYNYFTSFGYFSEEENILTLEQFYKALQPGGRLLIDLANRDYIIANYRSSSVERKEDGSIFLEEGRFDPFTSRYSNTHILIEPGRQVSSRSLEFRMYSAHEITGLLREQGFSILKVCDGRGNDFQVSSSRLVVVAEKSGK